MMTKMEMIIQSLQNLAVPVPSLKNINGPGKTSGAFIVHCLIGDVEFIFRVMDSGNKIILLSHVIEHGIDLSQCFFGGIFESN